MLVQQRLFAVETAAFRFPSCQKQSSREFKGVLD